MAIIDEVQHSEGLFALLRVLVDRPGNRTRFLTSAPRMTRSMHSALSDLRLDRIFLVFPGDNRFRLHERVDAVGLESACSEGFL